MNEPIELLGHKGRITHISSQLSYLPWQKEDMLAVWIEFDEAVEGTLSFATNIPIKQYSKDELLRVVKVSAELDLAKLIAKHRKEQEEWKRKEAREEQLDNLAKQLESMF